MDINKFEFKDILNLSRMRYQDKKLLPHSTCVYFAVAKDVVLYIGKTKDLNKRWVGHHKEMALRSIDDVYIYYLEIDAEYLSLHEGSLIRKFNPILNEKTPQDPKKQSTSNEGIPRSIRFDPDIYRSLMQALENRRAKGESDIDFTKLVNNSLRMIMPIHTWEDLNDRVITLEQEIFELKSKV